MKSTINPLCAALRSLRLDDLREIKAAGYRDDFQDTSELCRPREWRLELHRIVGQHIWDHRRK